MLINNNNRLTFIRFLKIFLFTNIPLEETIEICTNEIFKESETVEGLSKTDFKELLSPATKESHLFLMGHFINKSMTMV